MHTNTLQTHQSTVSESADMEIIIQNLPDMLCNASKGKNHSTVKHNNQTDASMLHMHQHLLF